MSSTGSIARHYCLGNQKSVAFLYIQEYELTETWHPGIKFCSLKEEDTNAITMGSVLSVIYCIFKKHDKTIFIWALSIFYWQNYRYWRQDEMPWCIRKCNYLSSAKLVSWVKIICCFISPEIMCISITTTKVTLNGKDKSCKILFHLQFNSNFFNKIFIWFVEFYCKWID